MFSTKRRNCFATKTDSYKLKHWEQLPDGTTHNFAYYCSRVGAKFPETTFVGLQYLLKEYLEGEVVTRDTIEWLNRLEHFHLGPSRKNPMWLSIIQNCGGRLPLRIRAVPEGIPVPTGNVLMTVENLTDDTAPLATSVESLLTHVWYPSTVASLSRETFKVIKRFMEETHGNTLGYQFKLHDFGYRGVSSDESSAIGGFGHLVNGLGTDTLTAIEMAHDFYKAPLETIAFSVPATEHSIMTSQGKEGELNVTQEFMRKYPTGIISCVADSFDYYRFVEFYVGTQLRTEILNRKPDQNGNAVFVIRPDSVTDLHPTPEDLVEWTLWALWRDFSGTSSPRGYKVLNPRVRVLWGDGITLEGITKILQRAKDAGFSADNLVFGMGGGLLQKVNRDTQRFAFKSAAQKRNHLWHPVFKHTIDPSKRSFDRGRMKLIKVEGEGWKTVAIDEYPQNEDQLFTVFDYGTITKEYNLSSLRTNAAL